MKTYKGDLVNIRVERESTHWSKEQWEQLLAYESSEDEGDLVVLKRSRKPILEGDVFVFALSIREDVYFYGKVLIANLQPEDFAAFYRGAYIIAVFPCTTHERSLKDYKPRYDTLLMHGPVMVPRWYWTSGRFETVGNIPLTQEEKNLDYGFYHYMEFTDTGCFVKATGEKIDHIPKFYNNWGINTDTGINYEMREELIFHPELLEEK